MLNTTQLKEYAQLTQATYAYFAASDYQNSGGLKVQLIKESGSATKGANFTDKEATLFTERYELLNQSDNNDPSGFSGALFRDNRNRNRNRQTGLMGSASHSFWSSHAMSPTH